MPNIPSFTTDSGLRAEAVKIAEHFLAQPTAKLSALLTIGIDLPLMRLRAQKVIDGGGICGCLIRWSPRVNFRRFGAFFPSGKRTVAGPLIEVSSMLKAEGCHGEARSTLAHEIGHWIAQAAGEVGRGHGPVWKEVARLCGGEAAASRLAVKNSPEVEAEVDRLRKKRNGKMYVYNCERCGERFEFSPNRHRRSEKASNRGSSYIHTSCNGAIRWSDGEGEER